MKISARILVYQILTLTALLIAVVSVGSSSDATLFETVAKSGSFFMLAKLLYEKTNALFEKEERMKKLRKLRKAEKRCCEMRRAA